MPFDGVEVSEVTERLVIGRARIEAGWCRNHLHRSKWTWHGRRDYYCLLGSIYENLPPLDVVQSPRICCLLEGAIERLGYGHKSLLEFNDEVGRTQAEVLDVCDVAIAMSRGIPELLIFLRRKVA